LLAQQKPANTLLRIYRKLGRVFWRSLLGRDPTTQRKIESRADLEKLGTAYGGWIVPIRLLDRSAICYCFGVGEDISFDLALIDRFGCSVYAYDPTPRAIQHIQQYAQDYPSYHFETLGVWDEARTLRFYAPQNPKHVSHSALNLQGTDSCFEAQCKSLAQLMAQNGHSRIDLLKLDIEGAEYRVIDSILDGDLDVSILCVEYDEAHNPLDRNYNKRIANSIRHLEASHYRIVAVDGKCNYTLVKQNA